MAKNGKPEEKEQHEDTKGTKKTHLCHLWATLRNVLSILAGRHKKKESLQVNGDFPHLDGFLSGVCSFFNPTSLRLQAKRMLICLTSGSSVDGILFRGHLHRSLHHPDKLMPVPFGIVAD
jgi:hypothetical protein